MSTTYKKIVLAYSGGLDTSIIIPWLRETYGCEVIAVAGNVGQGEELESLHERAIKTGASKLYVENIVDEFVNDFVFPCLKAGAKYEDYLLGTAMARPVIAKRLAEIAVKEGADAIAHGCTGKGNDQVRFELTIKSFLPDMPVIAPWRIWDIKGREDAIEYAEKRGIPIPLTRETNYSKDRNLWHLSHEGLDLEDTANEPDLDKILELGVSPEKAPDSPTYLTLTFEKGLPVALDGVKMDGTALVTKLNELGGKNGIGILDLVENRLVGMKCRGVYETPGGAILYFAHGELERLCLDKETTHYKELVAARYAELVYNGQWYTPLREAIDAFVDCTQQTVTGEVKLKLYKGNIMLAGMNSPYSLYSSKIVTFEAGSGYNHMDSAGFVTLFGLPIKVRAQMKKKLEGK